MLDSQHLSLNSWWSVDIHPLQGEQHGHQGGEGRQVIMLYYLYMLWRLQKLNLTITFQCFKSVGFILIAMYYYIYSKVRIGAYKGLFMDYNIHGGIQKSLLL